MIKNILIVENTTKGLEKINESVAASGKRQYILGGVFTEFNVKNRNDRIYKSDKFLPHLDELLERKNTLGVIYGEFDHPDVFDTSLGRVSHTVEKAFFVKEHNRVDGEIKLLNTHWGKEAQALIDDDCPIFVSSRAAGVTESNGEVTIKKLFTYDAVADPGFSSAKMELRTINESLGLIGVNEGANFRIYDISDESKINDLFNMDKNEFVTKEQMEKYSNYLTEQIAKTKSEITETVNKGEFDPEKLNELFEKYESFNEGFTKIASYLDYLAETMQVLVQENKKIRKTNEKLESKLEKTNEKTKKIVEHNDYLDGELEKAINYTEYVAEAVDKSIDYANYIAETLDKSIDFSEYIAENVDNTIKYSEYIAENLDKSIDYSQYVAENLEKNIAYVEYIAEHVDNNIKYSEYIAEHVDNNIKYAEYIAEHVDNSIKYTEYVSEQLDNSIKYSEYIAENLTDNIAYGNYLAEAIDKNIEYNKYIAEKLNSKGNIIKEQLETPEEKMGEFKTNSVAKYYDEDDTTDDMTEAEPIDNLDQVQGQAQVQDQDEESEDIEGVNAQEIQDEEGSSELTPGQIVKIDDDKTGEILAMNADNGIAVVKLSDTGEVQEIQESRLSVIGDKIFDSENTLKKLVLKQINESKKRDASQEKEPHFLLFLTERKKAAYYNLSQKDKEKVIVAMNESKGYTNENEVLTIMAKALTTATRSFNDTLIDNIPGDLRHIWESLRSEVQNSILSSAQFYTSLTEDKMESFWNSRNLHEYARKSSDKITLLTEKNNRFDNTKLSETQLEAYLKRLQK